jgi:hypothetical protein
MIIIGTVAGSVGRPASSMVRAIAAGMNTSRLPGGVDVSQPR